MSATTTREIRMFAGTHERVMPAGTEVVVTERDMLRDSDLIRVRVAGRERISARVLRSAITAA